MDTYSGVFVALFNCHLNLISQYILGVTEAKPVTVKLGIHMHVCVCVYGKYQNPKINWNCSLIYICIRVRLRMIFKYTDIVCHKTHEVFANAYMNSYLNAFLKLQQIMLHYLWFG